MLYPKSNYRFSLRFILPTIVPPSYKGTYVSFQYFGTARATYDVGTSSTEIKAGWPLRVSPFSANTKIDSKKEVFYSSALTILNAPLLLLPFNSPPSTLNNMVESPKSLQDETNPSSLSNNRGNVFRSSSNITLGQCGPKVASSNSDTDGDTASHPADKPTPQVVLFYALNQLIDIFDLQQLFPKPQTSRPTTASKYGASASNPQGYINGQEVLPVSAPILDDKRPSFYLPPLLAAQAQSIALNSQLPFRKVFSLKYMGEFPIIKLAFQGPFDTPLVPGTILSGVMYLVSGVPISADADSSISNASKILNHTRRVHQVNISLELEESLYDACVVPSSTIPNNSINSDNESLMAYHHKVVNDRVLHSSSSLSISSSASSGPAILQPDSTFSSSVCSHRVIAEFSEIVTNVSTCGFQLSIPPTSVRSFSVPMANIQWRIRVVLILAPDVDFWARNPDPEDPSRPVMDYARSYSQTHSSCMEGGRATLETAAKGGGRSETKLQFDRIEWNVPIVL